MTPIIILSKNEEILNFLEKPSSEYIIILEEELGIKKAKHWKSWIKSLNIGVKVKRCKKEELLFTKTSFIV